MGRLDYPLTWEIGSRSLVLNGHRTADGGFDRAGLERTYQLESFDFSPLDIREQREGMHLLTGGDFGPAVKQFRHISLRGVIKAPDPAELEDMEAEFLAAFDIERAQVDAPTTFGLGQLVYQSPTHISGPRLGMVVREGFLCRPESYPITYDHRGPRGLLRRFAVQLVTGYPYRLLFPAESVVFSDAAGWSRELPNWTTRVGGTSRLMFDITFTDPASGPDDDFTITDGERSLVLDLSSVTTNGWPDAVLRVEMWSKQLYDADDPGRSMAHLRTSDLDSFFDVPAGGCTVSISHTTEIASVTATYQQSRA
jgi:hypothetical protein